VSEAANAPSPASPARAFWALRVLESVTLVAILIGIALFAYSLVDIVRIETTPGATNVRGADREIPPTAYPGFALFFGGMLVLQGVRVVLHRYRRSDGAARSDASPLYSDDGSALAPADDTRDA
jgi:hypothetical protein